MGKNIAAGVVGVLVAFGVVWLVEKLGHSVYPPPPDIDFSDSESIGTYIKTLPLGALLFVASAWFLGTISGTFAACRIGTTKPQIYAMVVTGLMLLATAANLIMIPHPLWFSILGIAGVIAGGWLGMKLGGGRSEPEPE